jgi:hypothetical protein
MTSFYHASPMRPWSVAALVTTIALGAAAQDARAAEVTVDRACFADPADRRDVVQLSGSGFAPDADYQVTLDGQPLTGGTGRTDAAGNLAGRFVAPGVGTVSRIARQHTFRLGVQQGPNRPETRFTVSRLFASFKPTAGDPAALRVRFSLYGFSLQGIATPPVYLHYVGPSGRVARTVRLGTAAQDCGFLRTGRRRLFGFTPRAGSWRLQFDTRRRYTRGTSRSSFLFYTVRVRVR